MLAATSAGSLPKPAWLTAPETLLGGQRDAVVLARRDQEQPGIDVEMEGELGMETAA